MWENGSGSGGRANLFETDSARVAQGGEGEKEVRTERGGVRRRCESGEGAEMLGLQRSVGRPYLSASTMGWTMSAQLDLIPACAVQRGYLEGN